MDFFHKIISEPTSTMITPEINTTENFFQLVGSGTVADLQKLFKNIELNEKAKIANSLNSGKETALLVAIKNNNFSMVKFLVEEVNVDILKTGRFKWKGADYLEALPLFAAILSDFTSDIFNFLSSKTDYDTDAINKFVVQRNSIPCSQKIDMLDIVGAASTLMLDTVSQPGRIFCFARYCWLMALEVRDMSAKFVDPSILNASYNLSEYAEKVFGSIIEFRTPDELEEIFSQRNLLVLESHALLVIQRILSRIDSNPHPFFLRRLLQFGKKWFGSANTYICMVDVVLLILEPFHIRQWEDLINYDWCYNFVVDALVSILYCLWKKKEPSPNSSQLPFASFMVVINYVTALVIKLQKHKDVEQQIKARKFVKFIADFIEMFTEHGKTESQEFKQWLTDYIKFCNSHPGVLTVLHVTCCSTLLPIKIVQIFIDGGADANAQDFIGDTPLHWLALGENSPNVAAATKLLLDAGAKLDQSNKRGLTPSDYFKGKLI